MDDFGLHSGINEAALRLAGMGRVHAIGCMVGAPAINAGSVPLRRLAAAGLDIGLHLDLTEHPLLMPARRSLAGLIMACYFHRLERASLRAEIRAQLDAFEKLLGHAPAFVDGHQHVHQFPIIRNELVDELEQRYRDRKPWLRSTRGPQPSAVWPGARWRQQIKPHVIELLGARGLAALARQHGFAQNRSLLGVYAFQDDAAAYLERLAAWLGGAEDADLLMCHASVGAHCADALAQARQTEYEVLAGLSFARLCERLHLVLRPMSEILGR